MKKMNKLILFIFSIGMSLFSCNKKEQTVAPTISNEVLTTVKLILTNVNIPFDKDTATWEQLLDNNGNPLPVDTSKAHLAIMANTTYKAQIIVLDKTQNPVVNVSDEIKERGNYHLFFYQPLPTTSAFVIPYNSGDLLPLPIPVNSLTMLPVVSSPLNLTLTITDHDTNPHQYPIGLESNFVTGNISNGWLRLELRHQPNVKNGTYTPGSTDLDVGFKVKIQ